MLICLSNIDSNDPNGTKHRGSYRSKQPTVCGSLWAVNSDNMANKSFWGGGRPGGLFLKFIADRMQCCLIALKLQMLPQTAAIRH
jgi:hypothetical protein